MQHISETLAEIGHRHEPIDTFCERLSGRTFKQWQEVFSNRLLEDVSKGRFNPQKLIPIERVGALCMRYDFGAAPHVPDDHLIFVQVKAIDIQFYNPSWNIPGKKISYRDKFTNEQITKTEPVEYHTAVMLNPDIYGPIFPLYKTVR